MVMLFIFFKEERKFIILRGDGGKSKNVCSGIVLLYMAKKGIVSGSQNFFRFGL